MLTAPTLSPAHVDEAAPGAPLRETFALASAGLTALVMVVAATALVGWMAGREALQRVIPGVPPMTPNAAIALLCTAGALLTLQRPRWSLRRENLLRLLAGVSALLAILTVVEYASGWNLHIDQLFFSDARASAGPHPGRMTILSALSLILIDLALVTADARGRRGLAETLAAATALLALMSAVGYVFGLEATGRLAAFTAMPPHTSLSMFVLATAFFFARPSDGLMAVVSDPGPGGFLVRRLLPPVFVLPIALAWISWRGQRAGYYGSAFATTLFVVSAIAALGLIVWLGGALLRRLESRRAAADRLRQLTEDQLRLAVSEAPVPMIIHDESQRILHMSRGWIDQSGFSQAETPTIGAWAGRVNATITFAGMAPQDAAAAAGTSTTHGGESSVTSRSGGQRIWDFSTTPLVRLGAEARTFLTIAVDVTERKHAEAELRRVNEDLEQRIAERTQAVMHANDILRRQSEQLREQAALLDLVPEGIMVRDLYGTIVYWSAGARAMYGWDRDDALGRVSHTLIPTVFDEPLADIEQAVLASGHWEGEGRQTARDGREIPVLSRWTLTRTDRGTPEGFLEVNRDITERKNAERALEAKADELARSNHELEQFAYVASHDLQEPLRMVSNYTQLLGRRYGDRLDADAHEFIGFAVDGAVRMQALINDLLQYARVGTRGKAFRTTALDHVVRDAIANLAGAVADAHAEIVVESLPVVRCDASQLVQVFQNLIGNAIKFRRADRPPAIRVDAALDGRVWRLSVADNGIGIDRKYFERIFHMFQRLHGREEYPGTGIGLALCKKIVERHGGRLTVASEPGQGATFTFTLPHAEPGAHSTDDPA